MRHPSVDIAVARDLPRIFEVWESSVRATHGFLGEDDMQFLMPLVKDGLNNYAPIHCLRDHEGRVYAFMGASGTRVDMLFVHADWRGRGAGRALMEFAMRELGAREVDVNEQNPAAVGFYRHLGFRVAGRSPLDATGRPFPILHMSLDTADENPWLRIPLADYEAHMSSPVVAQAQVLSDILAESVRRVKPRSLAVIGCAGGNGFERIEGTGVVRAVGIDINPAYVDSARARYDSRLPGLELFAGDIQWDLFACEPVDLVFAGLLFEYVDIDAALRGIARLLRPGGTLVSVVQLPGDAPDVTPSPYTSLRSLESVMRLVDPVALRDAAVPYGLRGTSARTHAAMGGKRLHVQMFRLN